MLVGIIAQREVIMKMKVITVVRNGRIYGSGNEFSGDAGDDYGDDLVMGVMIGVESAEVTFLTMSPAG